MKNTLKQEKGFILIMVLLIATVFVIFIPILTLLIKQEGRMTVKQTRSSRAFHLAEAGADRGLWKLKESLAIWDDAADGPIEGYNFDQEYTDIPGGVYKIQISSTSNSAQRMVTSIGKDNSGNEIRCVEVVLERASVTSVITAPSISFGGSCEVQWGPIASLGTMAVAAANTYFPKKMARGNITGIDPTGDNQLPNDDVDVDGDWSWKSYYDVPDPPEIDLEWYLNEATTSGVYVIGNTPNSAPWKNTTKNHLTDPDLVYYVTGNCELKNDYLKGSLIVLGNLNLSGNGSGAYSATLPGNVAEQYKIYDKLFPAGSWKGKPGPPTVTTYAVTKIAFEGFIYIGGNFTSSGTPAVNGALICKGSTAGVGNLTIYFNDSVALSAKTATTAMDTVSWSEKPAHW